MPHVAPRAERRRKVVVVGAGPAGWRPRACRRARARGRPVRGHRAGGRAGPPGVALAAPARADRHRRLARRAAGRGRRRAALLDLGRGRRRAGRSRPTWCSSRPAASPHRHPGGREDLVVSSWDVLSGQVKPAERVLVFDDNARTCATGGRAPGRERLRRSWSRRNASSRSRSAASTTPPTPASSTGTASRSRSTPGSGRCAARATSSSRRWAATTRGRPRARVDQVVVEHGTLPMSGPVRRAEASLGQFGRGRARRLAGWPSSGPGPQRRRSFRLFRIGDAIASRNIHAAIFDALRLAKDI